MNLQNLWGSVFPSGPPGLRLIRNSTALPRERHMTGPARITRRRWAPSCLILILGLLPVEASAQKAVTWREVREQFEATNPTLKAAQLGIDESRAAEITA